MRRCSVIRCIEWTISSSVTSRMRSTRSRRMAKVRGESVARRPSAMVNFSEAGSSWPEAKRARGVVGVGRFAADHLDFRAQGFRGDGRAGKQSSARNRRADHVQVGNFLQEFQRCGALSGDHAVVIVGMNERSARGAQQFRGGGFARGERRFAERNVRAVGFDGANFHLRGVARHHHPGADAAHLRRERQRRAVISRRVRHHASRRFRFAQGKDGVGRAANFERAGELQIFAFEIQQRARQLIERVGNHHLRFLDVWSDAAVRLANGLEVGARERWSVWSAQLETP